MRIPQRGNGEAWRDRRCPALPGFRWWAGANATRGPWATGGGGPPWQVETSASRTRTWERPPARGSLAAGVALAAGMCLEPKP